MPHTHSKIVRIDPAQQNLSKEQARFNSLIKKIEKLKQQLREWQETLPRYQQRVGGEYHDLLETFNSHRLEFIRLLDEAHADKLFKRGDQEKIRHLICTIAAELAEREGSAELKTLHDKYSEVTLDEQNQEVAEMMKAMMAEMLGVEVGDDVDISSPEKLHAFMQGKIEEERLKAEERQQQAEERRAKRKKTTKQIERETQQQAEALNVKKSIQEVFRKLVAVLHPDRESDVTERERKTALMQRVNIAYGKKDLLQLLELQLEVEQIDPLRINAISDERVKRFNTLLKEQVDELQQELEALQIPFKTQLDLHPRASLAPKELMARLEFDILALKRNITAMKHDLRTLKDRNHLKSWLKGYRIPQASETGSLDEFMRDFRR